MESSIDFISLKKGNPNKAIIAIHGWQGNRTSFNFLSDIMKINDVEWFFPEAPYILDDNNETRSWSQEVSPGVYETKKTETLLPAFFKDQIFSNYSSENVFVLGFSQGAIICFEFALHMDKKLGAVFPIAGMFREKDVDKPRFHPAQKDTPIIIGHGLNDDVIDIEYSRKIYSMLHNQKANVKLIEFNGGHKINLQYLKEVTKLINES
jgi:phospholipase/carboxylesterase